VKLVVNGNEREVPDALTVCGLLALLELDQRRVAVERNREIVPRSTHAGVELEDGDRIEIVQMVGGG
jgi:sulfur carrier protein